MAEMLERALKEQGIEIRAPLSTAFAQILTPEAMHFVATLVREFNPERKRLLQLREARQARLDAGEKPDFLPETEPIRQADWRVAPPPPDLIDRRVEITGPVDRKMVINALNSGAKVYMADFEDAHSPTWEGTIQGQINLRDAVRGTIEYRSPEGKEYRLNERVAVLFARPRGWHLVEKHVLTFSITPTRSSKKAPVPISTCRSWRATWRHASGIGCSCARRSCWVSRAAPFAPPC
jgi:malate synthase